MDSIKVITICGSMKFQKEMVEVAQKLELENGYVGIQCIYGLHPDQIDREKIGKLHYKRIDISDAIYVVNVNGYLGESTKKEIEYAKSLQKEVLSLEPLDVVNESKNYFVN